LSCPPLNTLRIIVLYEKRPLHHLRRTGGQREVDAYPALGLLFEEAGAARDRDAGAGRDEAGDGVSAAAA
jgi:hypothetical protein